MKRMIFLLLLLPISFGFDCSDIKTKDIGSSSINYSVFGTVDLNFNEFTFENFSFTFRGVPQVNLGSYATNGMISADNFNNTILFFHQPAITENLNWYFNTSLLISFDNEKIAENARFPYNENYPEDIKEYLKFTETANEDLRIKILANNLLEGVNDYLSAIAIISEFVAYYVEYDLNYFSLTSATATEVYNVRKGVCDEFSTLAISMFRSVGIPARYVSGYVYTNIGNNGCTNFEPHSWTEVYVPGSGWVSVDTTYKEFFWINSAHVPLYKNYDMLDISSLYLQRKGSEGSDFLNKNSYSFRIELLDYEKTQSSLNIDIAAPDEVAQDSYALINVSISNPTDYWVLDTLISSYYKTIKSIDSTIDLVNSNQSIPLVVPPMQTIKKYFIFKMPALGCGTDCYLDVPFNFSLGGGEYSSKTIRINPALAKASTLEELLSVAKEDEKIISPELLVSDIKFNKNKFLEQNPILSFSIKNIGNSMMNVNLSIMYDDIILTESIESLLINEQRDYEKELVLPGEKGIINVILRFDFENTSLSHNSSFIALKEPKYNISVSKLNDFDYRIVLNSSETSLNGVIKAYVNGKEVISQEILKNNAILLSEDDFAQGTNNIQFVLDYSQGQDYYFKTLNVSYDYSLSFFGMISRFFESIINIFKILLSA